MVSYVNVATFWMTLLMNNFTSIVMDDWNYIEIHLVSDKFYNIVNLYYSK